MVVVIIPKAQNPLKILMVKINTLISFSDMEFSLLVVQIEPVLSNSYLNIASGN